MATREIETDYLVVGSGNSGMSFVDSLLDATDDVEVVMVDRRHAPGGHWVDCYPFVRLHQASTVYGVESTLLGVDAVQAYGPEQGWYDRASGREVCGYFDAVMTNRFLASGRVRYFPMSDYLGDGVFRSLVTGRETRVRVRRKTVDATYTQAYVPALEPPPFEVAAGIRCVPPGELVRLDGRPAGFVVVGSGKTAMDTVLWLLQQGTGPDEITWIRPRDVWAPNRAFLQPNLLAAQTVEGTARLVEAVAASHSVEDAFERLEAVEFVYRIDRTVRPTMIKGATLSAWEVEQLRRVTDVVRLGKVQRIEQDRIVLDHGEIPTSTDHLHVHCAAYGVKPRPPRPAFEGDTITLVVVTRGSVSLSSAMIARVEATELPLEEKNRLCPPSVSVDGPLEFLQMFLGGLVAEFAWRDHPELRRWLETSRLNMTRRVEGQVETPELRASRQRLGASFGPAYTRLMEFTAARAAASAAPLARAEPVPR
jgi:hypothetical protein